MSHCRARGRRGFTRQPENSKRAHMSAPALQTPPKFHEKEREILGPHHLPTTRPHRSPLLPSPKKNGQMRSGQIRSNKIAQILPNQVWPNVVATEAFQNNLRAHL